MKKWEYIDSGNYHDVWALKDVDVDIAVKHLRWLSSETTSLSIERLMYDTAKEARILDQFSDESIVNALGACGTTLWTPLASHSMMDEILPTIGRTTREAFEKYQQRHPHLPWLNRLSVSQKLDIAIDATVSLVALHRQNIVHGDVNPSQWLRFPHDRKNSLLLNDLNAAEILHWDISHDAPCASAHPFKGVSPEEAWRRPITTAADIYALGHVLYSTVTGLQPYFDRPDDADDDSFLPLKAAADEKPYISPLWLESSHAVEAALLEMSQRCWDIAPSKRPSAIDLLKEFIHLKTEYFVQ